ncbi:hypothetical protein SAMN05421647_102438 [Marinobacterium stanieri]|uniref:Uncharacterized protein n=2 Tax=Marinobacterium stanieri TaxID=49186 RepID=A0A1N6QDN9_9GAMM|nr:hypothetical protein SAMN05421647_102438 [Marinobacterium stanieri]
MIEGLGEYVPVAQLAELEQRIADQKRLTKELDIAMNGEDAAEQASLCDLVAQAKNSESRTHIISPQVFEDALKERDQLMLALSERLPHPDDMAVEMFAMAMREKMAQKREEGRFGWSDTSICTHELLNKLLCGHVDKGDPVDVGNFAMMLWHRHERTSLAAHDAEVIEYFKNELVKSVKPIFRPHIEGVCAVVQQQITQQAKEVQS